MKRVLVLLPLVLILSCATVGPSAPPEARAELAPTGKLRVGLIAVSPIFVTQNAPGAPRGIAVEIAGQLAERLGVPVELVRYPSERALLESAAREEWDVMFSGINPGRADVVNFTAPYMYVEDAPIGLGVQKKRPAAFAYAFQFIEQMKASGRVQEAISRESLGGARAAR